MAIYPTFKRITDILLSTTLLIILSPLFIVIATIIYLQDQGPAIFKQTRIGKEGQEFIFFKFRSMPVKTPDLESHEVDKLTITPLGKILRRTNIDELPQFFNVFKGDMSFIGPRPPIPSQANLLELRRQNGSLKLRPGLTGWAQVNSFDGMPESEKARFDGEYAQNFSLLLDLLILVKTVVYFTKKPPVY
jgi:O-antigen biosynthesis protein WbqP